MVEEEPRLIFSYFSMHKRCDELLRKLREFLQDALHASGAREEHVQLRHATEECALMNVPRHILDTSRFRMVIGVDLDVAIILGAAEIMREMIKRGDKEIKTLRVLSRSNDIRVTDLSASDWALPPSAEENISRRAQAAKGEFVNDKRAALTVKTSQICSEVVSRANDRLRDMDV